MGTVVRRLLVNDMLSALPDHRTFWNDLQDWFDMEFVDGEYKDLTDIAQMECGIIDEWENIKTGVKETHRPSLIIRNASYFGPLKTVIPTISLLQDIFEDGSQLEMQEQVIKSSTHVVCNSEFTQSKYTEEEQYMNCKSSVIPLPVDFSLFEPQNPMGLQQALSLPDNCICWIGAHEGAAGMVKGYDIFLSVVRQNPDLSFVAVFKDDPIPFGSPNLRTFSRITHEELVKVIGACRVGLCTSRMESQHLAGIEMGACGLPMIAPQVGVYWEREDIPGILVKELKVEYFANAIRAMLKNPGDPQATRQYWQTEFDRPVVKALWENLINEVES